MGIHKEFIEAALLLNIRTIFTTHDYFGICPKVTLYRCGQVCEEDHNCRDCIQCNYTALAIKKIQVMQSHLYQKMKNSYIVKILRKKHRIEFFSEEKIPKIPSVDVNQVSGQYRKLREYYIGMLKKIDIIHFNSTLTEAVYKRYFVPRKSVVISITHKNISDKKNKNVWKAGDILKLTCLAPAKPFKGFGVLREALDELWDSGKRDFQLNIYSSVRNPSEYMNVIAEGFRYDELEEILAKTDVLVAPSIWYETFGFTVLEAISYGVPVIVSNHVGAKDIIGDGGIIVEAGNVEQLKETISSLDAVQLKKMRSNIICDVPIKTWKYFVKEIYQMYNVL
jgi:glycosyltransferase involved in cell wall biosynthesis